MAYFKDIIGQTKIKDHLKKAIENKNPSHAYILAGELGSGRSTIADTFAAAFLCENPTEDFDCCGKCKSCLQAFSKNHPDIHYISHEKYDIKVDEIRDQLINDIDIKPYSGKFKIYIIPEAHRMNENAQNALLKTLEEPPEYGVIILLTENKDAFLDTVQSRCITLSMQPVSKDEISAYLVKNLQMEKDRAELAAGFCKGNIGQAIRFAEDSDFLEMKNQVLQLVKRIDNMNLQDIMEVIQGFSREKGRFYDYIDLMLLWYRDVLMYKSTKDINILLFSDEYTAITEQASKRSYEDIENIINALDKVKVRLDANVNFDLAIEMMLLNIRDYS